MVDIENGRPVCNQKIWTVNAWKYKKIITTGPVVAFKLEYSQLSCCFGKKSTVETMNIFWH